MAQNAPFAARFVEDHDNEAFNLFGGPSVNVTTTTPAQQAQQPVYYQPEPASPSNYELFPMAPAESVVVVPTKTILQVPQARSGAPLSDADLKEQVSPSNYELFPMATLAADSETVAEIPTKTISQVSQARSGAPPTDAELEERVDLVEEKEFVLFPTTEVSPTLESSESIAAAMEDRRYSDSSSYSRSSSVSSYAPSGTVSPSYKVSGNAVDIIAVRSIENEYFTTPWHVMFGWSRFRSNISTGVGDMVRVFVNGNELPTKMQLLEKGRCVFVTGGLTPPVGDLCFTELNDDRPNHVRFEHYQKSSDTYRYVDARLHVWGPNESVVVADLDGTLTISDVEGHIRTLRLGQYDFLHKGACDFFAKLHELELRIVYLTARPIDWATASRTHLENATQHAHSLPPGPLITNSNGLTGALLTEVVNKNPHIFKAQVLNEIQLTMIHAGRVSEHPVFVAGFGNRPTDIIAYENVGMDPSLIFMLDPYSNLKASSDPRIYESYSDPNALLWLLPRLKHRVPIEKVAKIDDYTVRELVLAEDREQLLMAERQARALQEEEYERARASGASNYDGSGSSLARVWYGS